jgi:hypothetical protein
MIICGLAKATIRESRGTGNEDSGDASRAAEKRVINERRIAAHQIDLLIILMILFSSPIPGH